MKSLVLLFLLLGSAHAHAELCDVRMGQSIGLRVVEFVSGNTIHSKMSLKDTTADSIASEMLNLQEEGLCDEKIIARRCVLRYEKKSKTTLITLFRGEDRWVSWLLSSKKKAQDFIKNMKRTGFCS
jgi:hypothetical protein